MIFKVVHGLVDISWLQNKVLTRNPQCTRVSHSWKYARILPHNDTFKFSFIPRTIMGPFMGGSDPHFPRILEANPHFPRIFKILTFLTFSSSQKLTHVTKDCQISGLL